MSHHKIASKPLFRDPVFDGAADPVVIWNRQTKKWWMFYTNRRANVPDLPGVSWVHGTRLGMAESGDGGATWKYLGTANLDYGEGEYSYWAPDILFHGGTYHMFLTFVPGIHADWSGTRQIVHLTSEDLENWTDAGTLDLSSDRVIDASVVQLPNGSWRLWYNDETDSKAIYSADSFDLYKWQNNLKVVGANIRPGEGPKVFRWQNFYWMIVDHWNGLGVYCSSDAEQWTAQKTLLLADAGGGKDDGVIGNHADVVVSGDGNDARAYIFYFTHPGRCGANAASDSLEQRRSSIQVADLKFRQGELSLDRDAPTFIDLLPSEESFSRT